MCRDDLRDGVWGKSMCEEESVKKGVSRKCGLGERVDKKTCERYVWNSEERECGV